MAGRPTAPRSGLAAALSVPGVRGGTEDPVGGDVVKPAQCHQVPDRQFVGAPLIAGVHGLGGAQYLRHLGLGQVVVFTQISDDLDDRLHFAITPMAFCP